MMLDIDFISVFQVLGAEPREGIFLTYILNMKQQCLRSQVHQNAQINPHTMHYKSDRGSDTCTRLHADKQACA